MKGTTNNVINTFPKSLKQAYSLVLEKTAFYSKQYPDDVEKSPDIEGMENMGFVENPTTLKQIMDGMALRNNVTALFAAGGWNNPSNPKSFLRDFEFSFLQPVCQHMAKARFSNSSLEQLISKKSTLKNLEEKIQIGSDINLIEDIAKDVSDSNETKALLEFCYNRSGKTVNDVTLGEGEVLLTLFTNASKAPEGGDLIFPNAGKVEVKGDEGRIGKPGKHINDNFKIDVKNYLVETGKPLVSQNKKEVEQAVQQKQQELSELFNKSEYKQIFTDKFELKILDTILELNSSALTTLKKEIFAYKIPKDSKVVEKSLSYVIDQYKNQNFLKDSFDEKNEKHKEIFRSVYNEIRDVVLGFDIGTTKTASDIFGKQNTTFLKNFVVQNFNLNAKEMATVLCMSTRGIADVNAAELDVQAFLEKDDNYNKMQSGDQSILQIIILSLQLLAYSHNEFNFLLIVNKQTKQGLSINCSSVTVGNLIDTFNKLKEKIEINIVLDNRGGSQITLK